MKLLSYELRKIWRPGVLLALVLLGAFYYYLFLSFSVSSFPNGPYNQAEFDLAAGWVEKYGVTMEASERAMLDEEREAYLREFARRIAQIPDAPAQGLTDYASFSDFREEVYMQAEADDGAVDMEKEGLIQRIIDRTNYPVIQSLDSFIAQYDAAPSPQESLSPGQQRRLEQIEEGPQLFGFLPIEIFDVTQTYGKALSGWMLLSVILLVSPLLVRDRLTGVRQLQWTSAAGRAIFKRQGQAVALSALLLCIVNLAIFGGLFLSGGMLVFRHCGLASVQAPYLPWFDWTYGQYLLILACLQIALALAAGMIAFVLSQYSSHYIGLLFTVLPLFVFLRLLAGTLFSLTFFFGNRMSELTGLPGAEGALAALLLICALLLAFAALRRQKRRELT